MIPIPKKWIQQFLEVPYSYEIVVAMFLVIGGAANAIRSFHPDKTDLVGWLWTISASGVFLVSLAKSWVQWKLYEDKQATHELAGCLHVLHSVLSSIDGRPP